MAAGMGVLDLKQIVCPSRRFGTRPSRPKTSDRHLLQLKTNRSFNVSDVVPFGVVTRTFTVPDPLGARTRIAFALTTWRCEPAHRSRPLARNAGLEILAEGSGIPNVPRYESGNGSKHSGGPDLGWRGPSR